MNRKRVSSWYGVMSDEPYLFIGTAKEVSDFRIACHEVFRREQEDVHRKFFPNRNSFHDVGGCRNRSEFRALTYQTHHFEKSADGKVYMVSKKKKTRIEVHPNFSRV